MESEGEKSKRYSAVWQHFTRKGNWIATCNKCHKEYSYKATVSNLAKHWKKKHTSTMADDDSTCSDLEWSDHSEDYKVNLSSDTKKQSNSKSTSTWQYFDVLDSDKFIARCKVCDKDVSYDSVSDLTDHVKEHNPDVSDNEEVAPKKTNKKLKSAVWQYMRITDSVARNAMCLLCHKQLSYMTSISNLRKHLKRTHPHVCLSEGDEQTNDVKKLIVSANGQIYEIETSDSEKDPIKTNTLYLEESVNSDMFDNYESKTPPKKKRKVEKPYVKRNTSTKELFHNIKKSNSSDEDTPKSSTKMNSLDYFGQYILSLMQELPKNICEQLQGDIIKQIITAKVNARTPTYSLTLSDKPVTVTLNSNNASIPEITVLNSGNVVMSENNEKSRNTPQNTE